MNELFDRLGKLGIVPVVVIDDAADAAQLGEALQAGGLPCAEITLRTPAAVAAIERMAQSCPDVMVGAGTVLTVGQAETAVSAGAKFIVTPGFDADVVDYCQRNQIPIIPGVMTPTEINMALNKGLTLLKFFPAEAAGGAKALKAIGGPYGDIKFMPTGGINPKNLAGYLMLPMVHACGGSWLVDKELIANGDFEQIMQLAAAGVQLVQQIRAAQG